MSWRRGGVISVRRTRKRRGSGGIIRPDPKGADLQLPETVSSVPGLPRFPLQYAPVATGSRRFADTQNVVCQLGAGQEGVGSWGRGWWYWSWERSG